MSTTTMKMGTSDGNIIASQVFAQVFRAYLECSDEVQAAVRDMAEIVNDSESTEQEVQSALITISEALFPTHTNGSLGVDLEECEQSAPEKIKKVLDKLDRQEATFADRVNAILEAKTMTQTELATASGVGQPAISMMLSRKSRPQHATVEKIAQALDIPPADLWPEYD